MESRKLYAMLLIFTAASVWILLGLQLTAMKFYLYWVFEWFDILMHGLGGVAVGFFIAALLVRFKDVLREHSGIFVFLVLAGTVFIGLLWESLELVLDLYMKEALHQPSVSDTILDLIMDGVGALVAGIVSIITIKKYGKA